VQGVTRILSAYVASSRFDQLPERIRHEGVRAFVNWAGCAAGGSREDTVEKCLPLLAQFDGAQKTTVIGRHEQLDALNAALINSMSSAVLAFNDTHFTTVAHPTSPVAATLFSLAQTRVLAGKDFVHALILGIEIQCRVGNILCTPPAECGVGLSMQGLVGGMGAAVAAAKVLGLDENGIATAIGHAANQAAGLREAHATMGSAFTPAHAARCGLMAALLAERGFTGPDQVIEGPKGFAVSYGQRPNFAAALSRLGEAFEISKLAYKPYPSGFVIHPIIDACLQIARNNALDPAQIERIELEVNPLAVQLTSRPEPKNRSHALVSLQHWTAASLVHKAAGIAQVTDAMVRDPVLAELRRKVTVTACPDIGREAARARVILKNGKRMEAAVQDCIGSEGRPMTDHEISEKTAAQLRQVFAPDVAAQITAACWAIEPAPRVDTLCQRLGTQA
jgi:2-methylcitrate dehydratase PrpD